MSEKRFIQTDPQELQAFPAQSCIKRPNRLIRLFSFGIQLNLPLKYWMSVVRADTNSSVETCNNPATKSKAALKTQGKYVFLDGQNIIRYGYYLQVYDTDPLGPVCITELGTAALIIQVN